MFEYGNLSKFNINELWLIMICLGGMFIGGLVAQITSAVLYSMNRIKLLVLISVFTYTIFTIIKIINFYFFGIIGIAITLSIYSIVELITQISIIKIKLK